jgi:hypothetical protein
MVTIPLRPDYDMDIEELRIKLRRLEFKRTEGETAAVLTQMAIAKGDEVRSEHSRLAGLAAEAESTLNSLGWIREMPADSQNDLGEDPWFCGLDGSFYALPSGYDVWYVPISVAKIRNRMDFSGDPEVVVEASIESLRLPPTKSVFREAGLLMLAMETRALLLEADDPRMAHVFLDGPIADPPFYSEPGYVGLRAGAIAQCLERGQFVVGCVKRVWDRFFITQLAKEIDGPKGRLFEAFPNDYAMFTHVFAKYRRRTGFEGSLCTIPLDVSDLDATHSAYREKGIGVVVGFFQRARVSRVARVDLPYLARDEDPPALEEKRKAFELALEEFQTLTLPGQSYPVPVLLAHEKCKVRQGCAEVLYLEIMTRSAEVDPQDFVTLSQLR